MRKELMKYNLLSGVLAGMGFALGNWGIESIALFSSHGMYPLAKLLPGLLICTLVGLLAGWLSGLIESVLANIITWAIAAAALNYTSLLVSFPGMQWLAGKLDPQLQTILNYNLDYGVITRSTMMLIIMVVFGLLAGLLIRLLTGSLIEDSRSTRGIQRWIPVLLWLIAFFGIGVVSDSLSQKAMRQAVATADNTIQFLQQIQDGDQFPAEMSIQKGWGWANTIHDYLYQPYRIISANYDQMMYSIHVLIRFEKVYAYCPVTNKLMGTCSILNEIGQPLKN